MARGTRAGRGPTTGRGGRRAGADRRLVLHPVLGEGVVASVDSEAMTVPFEDAGSTRLGARLVGEHHLLRSAWAVGRLAEQDESFDGPLQLLLLADTHLPRRARALPAEVIEAVASADLVVHAGDWVEERALDDLLEAMGADAPLLACWGNNDGAALRARLPEMGRAVLAGLRVEVVHETGGKEGRESRCEAAHPAADVLVFGHSHIPWDTTTPRGLRLLNPGSPTDRRRQPRCTYLTATAVGGQLADVELHELPLRRP